MYSSLHHVSTRKARPPVVNEVCGVCAQMEARFKLRKTAESMVAEGGVSGLQMVVRTLGRVEPARFLLKPTELSLAVSQPPDCGMHVDIAVSNVTITVSPG